MSGLAAVLLLLSLQDLLQQNCMSWSKLQFDDKHLTTFTDNSKRIHLRGSYKFVCLHNTQAGTRRHDTAQKLFHKPVRLKQM